MEYSSTFENMESLQPQILKVWRLKTGLWLTVFFVAALVFDILNLFDAEKSVPFGLIPFIVLAAGLPLTFWLTKLRFRHWSYALLPDELVLKRGVFNRVSTIVPLRRIQHLDVSQDIFEREYELGKLIVHTAGTRSSSVILPGLALGEAERLRDEMKKVITDEAL